MNSPAPGFGVIAAAAGRDSQSTHSQAFQQSTPR